MAPTIIVRILNIERLDSPVGIPISSRKGRRVLLPHLSMALSLAGTAYGLSECQ